MDPTPKRMGRPPLTEAAREAVRRAAEALREAMARASASGKAMFDRARAEGVGVSRSAFYDVLAGARRPDGALAVWLARALEGAPAPLDWAAAGDACAAAALTQCVPKGAKVGVARTPRRRGARARVR